MNGLCIKSRSERKGDFKGKEFPLDYLVNVKTKGEHTRHRIIETSMHLFSVTGFFNTSINDIQEATELTKGGLYAHFKSKEEIWWAVYEEAIDIWKGIVFREIKDTLDPLARLEKTIENDMRHYIGGDTFKGGCFFLNMLVELSGQSQAMSDRILDGFLKFAELLRGWLQEAGERGMLKPDLDLDQVSNFIMISLNGAAAFYAATKDPRYWKLTIAQLKEYVAQLKADR